MASSDNDQLPMDLGIEIRRSDQAWLDWVDVERRAREAGAFRDRIGLAALPPLPWTEDSDELTRISTAIKDLIPDLDAARAPQNCSVTDGFACFVVECAQRWAGAELSNDPVADRERVLFADEPDVNPLLRWPFDAEATTVWGLIDVMTYYPSGFSSVAALLAEYCTQYLSWCLDNDVDSPVLRYVYPDGLPS